MSSACSINTLSRSGIYSRGFQSEAVYNPHQQGQDSGLSVGTVEGHCGNQEALGSTPEPKKKKDPGSLLIVRCGHSAPQSVSGRSVCLMIQESLGSKGDTESGNGDRYV